MPQKFTNSLAKRLNSTSKLNVIEAKQGDALKRGQAYVAPGDYHIEIVEKQGGLVASLNQKERVSGLRPTVDFLMKSISKISRCSKIGVILIGMGSDGAKGFIDM